VCASRCALSLAEESAHRSLSDLLALLGSEVEGALNTIARM
jgi:hypothetical protein